MSDVKNVALKCIVLKLKKSRLTDDRRGFCVGMPLFSTVFRAVKNKYEYCSVAANGNLCNLVIFPAGGSHE